MDRRKTVGASLTAKGRAVADLLRDADLMVYRGDPDGERGLDGRKAATVLVRLLDCPALLPPLILPSCSGRGPLRRLSPCFF